jgi:NAD(P)-dependent dehydrogenase (short-subunit alcohol dehydrogenase family)
MKGLKDKRIIIGGAATGFGAALAARLVAERARLVVGDINETGLNALLPKLIALGGRAVAVVFDLADEASIGKLAQRCVDEYGGIDGLVITGADLSKATLGRDDTILTMETDIWERAFKVNTMGHALLMRAAIPHMVAAGGGSIVSLSSGAAYAGAPFVPAYSVTKAGIPALIRHVARLCGKDNIRCNAVAPGTVATEGSMLIMTDDLLAYATKSNALPRPGTPGDIASMLAFLMSDESSWLTGQVITVDGGAHFRG